MSASKSGRSARARYERILLGAFMSVVAFLIERRLMRARRQRPQ